MHAEGSQDTGPAEVKSLIHRPPLFYGENPGKKDVMGWLRLCERIVVPLIKTSRGWPEFVVGMLRGNAQSLYETGIEQ